MLSVTLGERETLHPYQQLLKVFSRRVKNNRDAEIDGNRERMPHPGAPSLDVIQYCSFTV